MSAPTFGTIGDMSKLRFFAIAVVGLLFNPAILSGQEDRDLKADAPTKANATPPVAPASAQAEAIAKHPELGKAGSDFNREFLARFRRYQTEKPAFFEDQRWPVTLADEVAKEGFASTRMMDRAAELATGTTVGEADARRIRLSGRTAIPPADAPPTVLRAIEAGNTLQTRSYRYGGGRDQLEDWGYDCSGTVSYVLIKAGLLDEPRTSGRFASYGEPGPGRWLTISATPGHCFMTVCGLRLDTGGRGGVGEKGPRWNPYPRPGDGYVMRHPPGF